MKECIGLFLGAGASCELGMPLVSELTKEFKDYFTPDHLKTLNDGWKIQGDGVDDSVIDLASSLLINDRLNYENILGYLQTAAQQRHRPHAEQYRSLYIIMLEIVYFQLYYKQIKELSRLNKTLPQFAGLKKISEKSDVTWVFSLNHDLIFESIADYCGIPIHDGFWPNDFLKIPISTHPQQYLYADILTEKNLNVGDLNILNKVGDSGINLIKLHGSLDVFTFRDGLDLCRLRSPSNDPHAKIATLKLANENLYFQDAGGKFNVKNEIVYTDDNGQAQFLRRTLLAGAQKFNPSYQQTLPKKMLDIFRSYINYVQDLYVIGYSFGDFHVDAIIRSWLEFSEKRSIKIVSPNPLIPGHLAHLTPQISMIEKKASEFFRDFN